MISNISQRFLRLEEILTAHEAFAPERIAKSDQDIIRYISTMFASLAVAYISVGVIEQFFDQPHGVFEVLFGVRHKVEFLTVAYSLVVGLFLGLFGCMILRFLDD